MNAAQSPYQALYTTFLVPVQRLLQRKREYLHTLESKDRLSMSEPDAKRCTAWINSVGQEIQVIENLMSASDDMLKMISELNEHVARASEIISEAQRTHVSLQKEYINLRQYATSLEQTETFFMALYQQEIQRNRLNQHIH